MIEWLKKLFKRKEKKVEKAETCRMVEDKTMLELRTMVGRIEFHEGLRLKPYRCTLGKLTIGIGRCIDTNPFTTEELIAIGDWKHGITKAMAYMLCQNDINRCIKELKKEIPFFANLDKERQYALIDLCFNMGIDGLKKFKKMLEALGTGNYCRASDELLNSKYANQVGKRAQRIALLIREGRWEINV